MNPTILLPDGKHWAELCCHWETVERQRPDSWNPMKFHKETHSVLSTSQTLHIYPQDAPDFKLTRDNQYNQNPHWHKNSHGKGRYGTGGHNWYNTVRIDVWAWLPDDPFRWYGTLITGGDNSGFRIRRTLYLREIETMPKGIRFNRRMTPHEAEGGSIRLAEGAKTIGFCKRARNGWFFGDTLPALITRFMEGEALAA